ncbi:MAG: histidine--tRNA ligase [Candidatus Woesearchaeota archaeon]
MDPKEKFELQLAKGVRDFPPEDKIIRDEIVQTIKQCFELYGFNPIETPIIERYETLAAKFAAGEESDALKEIFKLTDQGGRELGLRFDLTVPFCRFVGMNPKIKMPFKKYLMGQVFRDGPIKTGRYREFMQMDPDIVGIDSMLADAEIIALSGMIFNKLGFEVTIEFSSRKILDGIIEQLNIPEEERFGVIISIDKLKKFGKEEVSKELEGKGLSKTQISQILASFTKGKTNQDTWKKLKSLLTNQTGKQGLLEIEQIMEFLDDFGVKCAVFDPSLARGLAYYTGPVYEVYLKNSTITSSVAGGGRYDKIIGNYLQSKRSYPATGISYGVDVIIEAVKEQRKLTKKSIVEVYVVPIKTTKESIKIVQMLRNAGVKTDFDLAERGISKNLEYADAYGIKYVIIVGQKELEQGAVKIKNMETGVEQAVKITQLAGFNFK